MLCAIRINFYGFCLCVHSFFYLFIIIMHTFLFYFIYSIGKQWRTIFTAIRNQTIIC